MFCKAGARAFDFEPSAPDKAGKFAVKTALYNFFCVGVSSTRTTNSFLALMTPFRTSSLRRRSMRPCNNSRKFARRFWVASSSSLDEKT
jgi:hypothetical protein